MQFRSISHSFDCLYFSVFSVKTEHQAGENRASIDEDRARTALTKFTAMLRAGEVQILSQNFQQCLVRCEGDFRLFAVECETNMFLTVALHRLSSSPYSKSYYRSDASCRRMRRLRSESAARRSGRSFPTSLRLRLS